MGLLAGLEGREALVDLSRKPSTRIQCLDKAMNARKKLVLLEELTGLLRVHAEVLGQGQVQAIAAETAQCTH
eukprot:4258502-Alexandrium_andersonii.AAC.1